MSPKRVKKTFKDRLFDIILKTVIALALIGTLSFCAAIIIGPLIWNIMKLHETIQNSCTVITVSKDKPEHLPIDETGPNVNLTGYRDEHQNSQGHMILHNMILNESWSFEENYTVEYRNKSNEDNLLFNGMTNKSGTPVNKDSEEHDSSEKSAGKRQRSCDYSVQTIVWHLLLIILHSFGLIMAVIHVLFK